MAPSGYRPGVVAEIVRLHADYYAREWGFGLAFETKVAAELSAFLQHFDARSDYFGTCWDDHGLTGTVSIEAPKTPGDMAHLRWFITHDRVRGTGIGRQMLLAALDHADSRQFPAIYLTTFAGLEPARRLYESVGFRLVAENAEDQWQGGVREQRYERMWSP